jgi:AAA domain, putative AbiEii toxin, Type IV TA system/AAA domain
MTDMYLNRVVLRNIKGFSECDLDFHSDDYTHSGWSVITGDNGSGKTALLKAIAIAILGPDQIRGLIPDLSGWVTVGEEKGSISVEIKPDHDYDRTQRGGFPASTFWAEVGFERRGPAWDIYSADIFRNKRRGAVNGPWASSTSGWFALGYGPFRRLYGSSPDAQRLMVIPGRIPHFATLFKEDATLAEGEEWVKQQQYRRLEERQVEKLALENLLRLLSEDFLRQGVQIKEVNSEGIWLCDAAGRVMPLADMSDGYRSALAMLIDIYRHMVSVYGPDILSRDENGANVVSRPGVVLIDEIDTHLHPAWQREIGFWLKRHLPQVQFIVTSHSPLVCQAADGGRIFHLPQPGRGSGFRLGREDYDQIIAGKPDEILLSPAFELPHTRSPRAVAAREKRARLKAKQKANSLTPNEESELQQLELFV